MIEVVLLDFSWKFNERILYFTNKDIIWIRLQVHKHKRNEKLRAIILDYNSYLVTLSFILFTEHKLVKPFLCIGLIYTIRIHAYVCACVFCMYYHICIQYHVILFVWCKFYFILVIWNWEDVFLGMLSSLLFDRELQIKNGTNAVLDAILPATAIPLLPW